MCVYKCVDMRVCVCVEVVYGVCGSGVCACLVHYEVSHAVPYSSYVRSSLLSFYPILLFWFLSFFLQCHSS